MDKAWTQMGQKFADDAQSLTFERWHKSYMCPEKKREDSPTLKIAWLHQYDDLNNTLKRKKKGIITAASNSSDNIRTNKTNITRKQKWEEKQQYKYFKWLTDEILHDKIWTWLWKGNLVREIESLRRAAQNNVIIIMSCDRHGYPWPSLATSPYRSSTLVGLQGHIPYPHIAAECMFELVVLLLPGHMWRSIGVHHLWARPCFSSSVLHVWFV